MSPQLALVLVVVLIAANGLFVAAEFSLVAVRRPAIEEAAATGDRGARRVLRELQHISFVLSAAQFGITVTSLLVGFLAEGAIGDTLVVPVVEAVGLPADSSRGVSIAAAFLLSTGLQMVVGELAPKNLAIARPETIAPRHRRPHAAVRMAVRADHPRVRRRRCLGHRDRVRRRGGRGARRRAHPRRAQPDHRRLVRRGRVQRPAGRAAHPGRRAVGPAGQRDPRARPRRRVARGR